MIRVLFVCMGNICRSPMAEGIFVHLVREAGLEGEIEVDSAGTGGWHAGSPAHAGTIDVLRRNGIEYTGCARQLVPGDLRDFDYVITMDDDNLDVAQTMQRRHGGAATVAPLLSYAPRLGASEVPDPYFSGGFEGVYPLIREGAEGLLQAIRRERGL